MHYNWVVVIKTTDADRRASYNGVPHQETTHQKSQENQPCEEAEETSQEENFSQRARS